MVVADDFGSGGWADLFVTSHSSGSTDENLRTYMGLPRNAVSQKLYKNLRNGTRQDVTDAAGLLYTKQVCDAALRSL